MQGKQKINELIIEAVKKLNAEKGKVKVSEVVAFLKNEHGLESMETLNTIIEMEKRGVIKLLDSPPLNLEKYPSEIAQLNSKIEELIQLVKERTTSHPVAK